jgi:phosphatidylinositol alpha-mannosyltransferase
VKIVQLTPYAMDRPGGVQSHIRDLCTWLRENGHETRIIAPPSTTGQPKMDGVIELGQSRKIAVHGTKFELTRASRSALSNCVAELRDWGAEVAHLHTPWTPMLPFQVWRALDVPAVATFHATLPESAGFDPLSWALRRSAHWFNRRLSSVVVPSVAPQNQWRENGVTPLPKVLAPTVNLAAWRKARDTATPSTGFNAICMGRLEDRKGTATLLTAWRKVQENRPDARLIIAGDGPCKADLLAKAARDDLHSVTFVDPPSDTQARDLIAQADVLVAPALHGESFGLVLIEAMAAGTLPVAAANAGYATVMTGPGRELLVPPSDTAALTAKLLDLACHPALQSRLLRWAKGHADHNDVRHLGPAYETLFRDALR